MPDENNNGGDPNKINNQEPGQGTDPNKKNEKPTEPNAGKQPDGEKPFDEKVFDDPRLWQHPRFKSLNERAKKADELEKAQSEAEEKRLADNKKFEELANKRAAERDEIKTKLTNSIQDNRIITEASKIGVVDVEAVLKLVDRSNIKVADDGTITGVEEAVKSLVEGKPYLKGGKPNTTTIGSPSNPGADGDNQAKRFKLSQLQDPVFYREHEKDIQEAYKLGLIEDDMAA